MTPCSGVIPADAGIQCLFDAKTLGPRFRGDDEWGRKRGGAHD